MAGRHKPCDASKIVDECDESVAALRSMRAQITNSLAVCVHLLLYAAHVFGGNQCDAKYEERICSLVSEQFCKKIRPANVTKRDM